MRIQQFFIVVLLFVTPLIYAQKNSDEALTIGFVNIRKLITQAPQLSNIQEKLVSEFESENKAIITLRQEISVLGSTTKEETTDKNQLLSLQKEILEKQTKLSRLQQQLQDEYNLRRNEALGELQKLIVRSVAKVSKDKKLDIVLNNTGIIYVSSRIDITSDVLAYLSEQVVD